MGTKHKNLILFLLFCFFFFNLSPFISCFPPVLFLFIFFLQQGVLATKLIGSNQYITVYSHSNQTFTVEEDLNVGGTIVPAAILKQVNMVTLSNKIRFQENTVIVIEESKHICHMVAKLLNANPDIRIRVDGHVKMKKKYRKDEGKMKQAERLSQLRAKGVVKELIGFGIAKDRMDYKGFGGSVPLPKGQDDKRVEISVMGLQENR